MFAEITAKLDTLKTLDERLTKVESTRDQTLSKNNRLDNTDNTSNPDAQYLKNIKIDVPNFKGRHDPQFFIDWILQLNRYFTWYELPKSREVKYAVMKLSDQASQYWTNLENRGAVRGRPSIDTCDRMKEELDAKYVSLSFSARLMDNWHQYTQGNKSTKEGQKIR